MTPKQKLLSGTPVEIDDISDKPGHLIRLVHQKGVALFESAFGEFNVTVGQQLVLVALYKHPDLDLSSLAQLVTWDRSTTGDVVSRLSRRGLVIVTPSSKDLRVKLISISPTGRALLMKMAPVIRRSQRELLSALKPAERLELIRLMRKIVGRGGSQEGMPTAQLDRIAPTLRPVALSGSAASLGAVVRRRLIELGTDVVAWHDDQTTSRKHIAKQPASAKDYLLPDGCQLVILCREWPGSIEGRDRSALAADLIGELDVLSTLLDAKGSDLHVVVALSLMPDQEPGCIEMAAGLKRAFLYFGQRRGSNSDKSTLATVITGAISPANGKGRRRSPSSLLAGLEDAADAVLFAAQSARKLQSRIVIDQLPELG